MDDEVGMSNFETLKFLGAGGKYNFCYLCRGSEPCRNAVHLNVPALIHEQQSFEIYMGIFLFITASRTALGPTQPPIQWVPRALSLGVKRPGREADHSPLSSAEVKE
jgi:hypothetical protein